MADDNAKWFNFMILVVACFTLIELLVLVWGLNLRGPWLWVAIIAFVMFLLPMPYLVWLMSGARSPGYWTALLLVRPVFAWHFNWIMFVFFLAMPIIVVRAAAGFAGAQAPITVMRWVVLSVVTVWGLVTIYGLLATVRRPGVERVEIKIPGLAAKDDGLKVVQLSDLHVAWWTSREELEQMAEQVKSETSDPEVEQLANDIITAQEAEIEQMRKTLDA